MRVTNRLLAQSAEMGALPELYAATRPNLDGGLFIGPDGFEEQRGHPKVRQPGQARRATRRRPRGSGTVSEELTGVSYEFACLAAAWARSPSSTR